MGESFLIEHGKLVGTMIVVAVVAGILAAITGRAVLRKWLLNGTDDNIKEIRAILEEKITHACPLTHRGGTPLTKEEHQEICDQNKAFQAQVVTGKHDLVMGEIVHLREGQRVVKDDIKKILREVREK